MTVEVRIRLSNPADAQAISSTILSALHHNNAQDYAPEIFASVAANFAPERVTRLMSEREVFVASLRGEIVGTASLQGSLVRTVFVSPYNQRRGIGAALMRHLESQARERNVAKLTVPSSVTSEGFYRKMGYEKVGDRYHGAERTITMEKVLEHLGFAQTASEENAPS